MTHPAAGAALALRHTEPTRRLSRDARRQQLLDTAADLLQRDGADALTMEGIGQAAGASKTLGYAYFDNVEHVVVALRERELHELYARVREAAAAAETFDERVAAAFHAYFDIVAARGPLLGELEQAMHSRRIAPTTGDDTDAFLSWLAGLIADEFGVTRRRATWYAAITAGLANAHAAIWKPSGYGRDRISSMAIAFALGGLRAAIAGEGA